MVNKAVLIGRVGKNPETKEANGKKVTTFSLATSENYKDKSGQKVENTVWHNIVIWGNLAEIAEKYVKKGDLLYVEGKINNRSYDDKDGNKKYISEIVASELKLAPKAGNEQSNEPKSEPQPQSNDASSQGNSDEGLELPF